MKQDIVDALIARIREDYTRLDMRSFRTQTGDGLRCAGCLGGNAIALVEPAFMDAKFRFTLRSGLFEQAAEIMGLSREAAEELFLQSNWPLSVQFLLTQAPRGSRPYGEMCIRALKMFHENGDKWPTIDSKRKRKTNAT